MKYLLLTLGLLTFVLSSCYKEQLVVPGDQLDDWTTATHSADAIRDYDVVYPQNAVNRIDVVIESSDWDLMQDNLEELYGGNTGPQSSFSDETPVMVPCQFYFNDRQWYYVGIRYKGNSTLASSVNSGNGKVPFRLDFNEYENDYPNIYGQTFYGFQEISLANNYDDASAMREKVTADVFRNAGVPAPRTAFYRVYVDYGDGPIYFGLYTMVEVVFDTMLEDQFGNSSGNCYKPDGDAASFAAGTFNTAEFENKTNSTGDFSDVEGLYNHLQDGSRVSDPEQWKTELEGILDVEDFLHWLAVNTTIQNWDTYGRMTHNYYLYNDPNDGLLHWIPWDNNEALQEGKMGGAISFEMTGINEDWPLIDYLMQQTEYKDIFDQRVDELINGAFEPAAMSATYQYYHDLIEPYVTGSEGESSNYSFVGGTGAFTAALSELQAHAQERQDAANLYLGN